MKIAVLSGKGGTGKTFVSVNLAVTAHNATYIDCDVEEPNGHLFLQPQDCTRTEVFTSIPKFDAEKCNGCRKCVDFCQFNALAFIKNKPLVFAEVCHACGGCMLICPQKAVSEKQRPVGIIEKGQLASTKVITGILNVGEVSAVPVIKRTLEIGLENNDLTIIDCPPGSGCSVMETVMSADCCLLVIEPTAFGFHNFKMVYTLAKILNKPCLAIINKADNPYLPLEEFCLKNNLPIIARIPYKQDLAELSASGKIACLHNSFCYELFKQILSTIKEEVKL